MAERRMIAKSIIDSDAFLDLSNEAQRLYFHLIPRSDDEGFVANPKSIVRLIQSSEDALTELIEKRYLLTFPSGVVVIKHWRIHNYIQKDRFVPSTYVEERATLTFDQKNAYVEKKDDAKVLDTDCIQIVSKVDTQDEDEAHQEIIESLKGFDIVVDCEIPDWFDMNQLDKLYNALNESDYLAQWKVLSKYLDHWDKIVAGYYRSYKSAVDWKKQQAESLTDHQFTEEQLKSVKSVFDI